MVKSRSPREVRRSVARSAAMSCAATAGDSHSRVSTWRSKTVPECSSSAAAAVAEGRTATTSSMSRYSRHDQRSVVRSFESWKKRRLLAHSTMAGGGAAAALAAAAFAAVAAAAEVAEEAEEAAAEEAEAAGAGVAAAGASGVGRASSEATQTMPRTSRLMPSACSAERASRTRGGREYSRCIEKPLRPTPNEARVCRIRESSASRESTPPQSVLMIGSIHTSWYLPS